MILGFLDGCCHLSERQADAYVIHGQVEAHDVLDGHRVDGHIVLLAEQLHHILFLVLLLNELLADHVGWILFAIVGVNVLKLFIIAEEEVANDDIDNFDTDEEFVRVLVQIKVVMQCVGHLDAPIEILFLLVDRHPLVIYPRCRVLPLVVTTVLERGERLREIFDVATLFAFLPCDADFDHISALVQAEQAPDHNVTMSVHWDDLEGEIQRVRLLEWDPLLARHPGDPAQFC